MVHHNPKTQTYVLNMPLNIDPEVCAVVFDPQAPEDLRGEVYDEVSYWEAAIQYAQDGFIVIAINPSSYPFTSADILQDAIQREHDLIADCFGKPAFPTLVEA